jgi:pimeloyl-ACP methyl ester carboxylesterase
MIGAWQMRAWRGRKSMPYIKVGEENSGSIDLYYEDHGAGRPVVLIHGWPLSGASWERQTWPLVDAGYRVITYDRRGFGNSARTGVGYEYDILADDLNAVLSRLDLHDVALVGFSMGGGEVARYLSRHGDERICSATFISAIPPYLLKTTDNPDGVDGSVFDGILAGLAGDRPGFLTGFLANFYNVDVLGGKLISEDFVRSSWNVAISASSRATSECVRAWLTDFRADMAQIKVPTLFVHGDSDRIVPLEVSARRAQPMVAGSKLHVIKDAPHGLIWTHAPELNEQLFTFLKETARVPA